MAITSANSATVERRQIIVDPHPNYTALKRFWKSSNVASIGLFGIICMLMFPGFSSLFLLLFGGLLWIHGSSPIRFPLRVPMSSGISKDANNYKPGSDTPGAPPDSITCLGVDSETGRQVWENSDRERQHFAIIATTGSGKTYGLRFHMAMAFAQTTGIITIDGKGDIELPLDSVSLIRRFARDDDIRILNFKQGNENVYAENGTPLTNTFNPFSVGSSSSISEVLKSLLSDDDPAAGKGDVWTKRAEAMCDNISKMATYKRDHSDFKIRPGTIGKMLELRELCKIYVDPNIPHEFKNTLELYFTSMPDAFELSKAKAHAEGLEFTGKILEQHGYVAMQLQPALTILSDKYGRIFDTDTPEIDIKDVVINNRILMVLLPALEQSPGTTKQAGKILLAAIKGMIAGELGAKFQGNVESILAERSCSDAAPFKVFLDECGYYAVINGIEILPAQGRGLGFAFYFISQTFTDLEKAGKDIAEIIWGNCNNKQAGKSESDETLKKFAARAGQADVVTVDRKDIDQGPLGGQMIRNSTSLSITRRERLEMSDLAGLREGQFFHINGNDLIKIRTGDPSIKDKVKEVRYIQLVGLEPISPETQREIGQSFATAQKFFRSYAKNQEGKQRLNLDSLPILRDCLSKHREYQSAGMLKMTDKPNEWFKAITDAVAVKVDASSIEREKQIEELLNKAIQSSSNGRDSGRPPELIEHRNPDDSITDQRVDSLSVTNWVDLADEAASAYEADMLRSDETTNIDVYDEDDFGYEIDTSSPEEDDDSAMSEVSEYEVEKDHIAYQLQIGQLTQEQHDDDLLELQREFGITDGSEFDLLDRNSHQIPEPLDTPMVVPSMGPASADSGNIIEDEPEVYPSQSATDMAKLTSRDKLDELIQELDKHHDYSKI